MQTRLGDITVDLRITTWRLLMGRTICYIILWEHSWQQPIKVLPSKLLKKDYSTINVSHLLIIQLSLHRCHLQRKSRDSIILLCQRCNAQGVSKQLEKRTMFNIQHALKIWSSSTIGHCLVDIPVLKENMSLLDNTCGYRLPLGVQCIVDTSVI